MKIDVDISAFNSAVIVTAPASLALLELHTI